MLLKYFCTNRKRMFRLTGFGVRRASAPRSVRLRLQPVEVLPLGNPGDRSVDVAAAARQATKHVNSANCLFKQLLQLDVKHL